MNFPVVARVVAELRAILRDAPPPSGIAGMTLEQIETEMRRLFPPPI